MKRRTQLVAVGLASLLAAGLLGSGVPLFDGINYPDEPYRYVVAPPGAKSTVAPAAARVTAGVSGGSNAAGFEVATTESGPQISIYVPAEALRPDGDQRSATVSATPLGPVGTLPGNGAGTGDIYRVATPMASLAGGTAGTLTLRAPVGFKVVPVMDYRADATSPWQTLQTARVGNDVFEAPFERVGDYVMVLPTHGSSATHSTSRGVLIALAIFLGLAVVAVVVVRGFTTIDKAPDRDDDEADDDLYGGEPDSDPDGGEHAAGDDDSNADLSGTDADGTDADGTGADGRDGGWGRHRSRRRTDR